MLLQQLEDEEEMVQDSQAIALAVIHVGAEEACQLCVNQARFTYAVTSYFQIWHMFTVGTPWQVLYQVFITMMGFDVETFDFILDAGFACKWQWTTIPRSDTSSGSGAQPGG